MISSGIAGQTHPVSEPLLVVVASWALDCLNREVSREGPSDQVGNGLSEAKHVEEDEDDRAARWLSGDPSEFNV